MVIVYHHRVTRTLAVSRTDKTARYVSEIYLNFACDARMSSTPKWVCMHIELGINENTWCHFLKQH